tara:strand:+ start:354 stop:875 length:522 start_codon:yes stop_codon:yes gene_type:complete
MIKEVLIASAFVSTMIGTQRLVQTYKVEPEPVEIEVVESDEIIEEINLINGKIDNREELIEAMAFVESGGNPEIIGDLHLGSPSVGLLQIRPIMVREVNRILRKQGEEKRFKLSDRKDANSSIEMFNIWADAYHCKSSYEKMARNWNGGPKGFKKPSTVHYWNKVNNYVISNL